jgi:pimeloyl-ACP methyl ester carboxylesterase
LITRKQGIGMGLGNISSFKSEKGRRKILESYDRLLAKEEAPVERIRLDTKCGKTFLIASGDKEAPPVMLLHSKGANSSMWLSDMRSLKDRFRVYALDMPGEPGWSDERRFPFDSEDYAEWLMDAATLLNLSRMSLAGSSIGAWLAAKFAMNHPEMVARLAMLAPLGLWPANGLSALASAASRFGKGKISAKSEHERDVEDNYWIRRDSAPIFEDSDLRKLTMPCLMVLGGADSQADQKKSARRLKSLVPEARIQAHHEAEGASGELAGAAKAFLEEALANALLS